LAARQRRGVGFPHGRADEERGGAEPRLVVLGGDGAERARLGGEQRAARHEAVGLARHSDAEAHLARVRVRVRVRVSVRVRVRVRVRVKGRVRVRVRVRAEAHLALGEEVELVAYHPRAVHALGGQQLP